MESQRNTRQVSRNNKNARFVKRGWDQCVPKDKWAEVVIANFDFGNIGSASLG